MNDELKIVLSANLDGNTEKNINNQVKGLKVDPINIKVNSKELENSLSRETKNVFRELNETAKKFANEIIKTYGITNRESIREIRRTAQEYTNAMQVQNPDQILRSYENLFNSIKESFEKFKVGLTEDENRFLKNFYTKIRGKTYPRPIYINRGLEEELKGTDYYNYYKKHLNHLFSKNPRDSHIHDLYMEMLEDEGQGFLKNEEPYTEIEAFVSIADKIIELREKRDRTLNADEIEYRFGTDKDIKNRIDKIVADIILGLGETQKLSKPISNLTNLESPQTEKAVSDFIQLQVKRKNWVDTSDPNWKSIIQNAPFEIPEISKKSIKVPFQIDIKNPDEVKAEMERIVSEFTRDKGKLIDYRVDTRNIFDEKAKKTIEILTGATIKYKNELDEVVTKQLNWKKIGEEKNINGEVKEIKGFAETFSSYSQNIEKAIEKQEKLKSSTEKLKNRIDEYKKSFETLQVKAEKAGIKLSAENISGFNKAVNTEDLENVRHYMKLLKEDWNHWNSLIVKDLPNTALENMKKNIDQIPYGIDNIELKLKNLSAPTKDLQEKFDKITSQYINLDEKNLNEKNLETYGEMKKNLELVNKELTNQIINQRQVNREQNIAEDKKVFSNNMDAWLSENVEAAKIFEEEIKKIREQLKDADAPLFNNLKKQFRDITSFSKSMDVMRKTTLKEIDEQKEKNIFSNNIDDWINKNVEAARVFEEEIKRIREQLKDADIPLFNSLKKQFSDITSFSKSMDLMSTKALENIKNDINKIPSEIDKIGFKLKNLSSPSKELQNNFEKLMNQYIELDGTNLNEKNLNTYRELKETIELVNEQLTYQIMNQRQVNREQTLAENKKIFSNKMEDWLNRNIEGTKSFGKDVEKIKSQLKDADTPMFNNLKKQFEEITSFSKSMDLMSRAALENIKKDIDQIPYGIDKIELKLKDLSKPSKGLQEKFDKLTAQYINLDEKNLNEKNLETYKELKKNVALVNKELSNQLKNQRQINREGNLEVDKQTFLNRLNVWINENHKAARVFEEDIIRIKSQLDDADIPMFNNLKKQFTEMTTKAKSMGITGKTVVEKIVDSFKKLSSMFVGGGFALYAVNSLREVYKNVVSIDNAMVNLKKVTDETSTAYQNFLSGASTSAIKLGVGIPEMINATADFARLGYSLKDSAVLAQNAALFKNVSYTDIGTATKGIVSAMKAFNIEAKDSMKIVDILNEVGNKFSISSAGVEEGLRRSASSLAVANNTIEESVALITAANEVLQDPQEAGNSVKILALRLTGAKGKLEEMGESTDHVVESVTSLQTKLYNLTNGKVNIMADPTTFKSTYQIMKEIASVWDELNGTQRSSILELIAGKQRQNAIASLVQNIKTAKDVVEVATNSAGSAMREQEKRMDSISAKVDQFTANVQKLSNTVLDSGLIKFFVDLGSAGINSLEGIIEKVGSFSTLLTTFSTVSSLFGKQGSFLFGSVKNKNTNEDELGFFGTPLSEMRKDFDKALGGMLEDWGNSNTVKDKVKGLFANIGNLFNTVGSKIREALFAKQLKIDEEALNRYSDAVKNGVKDTEMLGNALDGASQEAIKYAQSTKVSSTFTEDFISQQKASASAMEVSRLKLIGLRLASAALNAAISFGLSIAIEKTIELINEWSTKQQKAIETSQNLIKANEDETKSLEDKSKAIKSIGEDYKQLSKGVDNFGKNISLTTDEYQKYNDITKKISEMFPELVKGRTAEGNAIIKQKGNIEELNKALERQESLLQDKKLQDAPEIFKGINAQLFEYKNLDIGHFFTGDFGIPSLMEQVSKGKDIIKNIDDIDKLREIIFPENFAAAEGLLKKSNIKFNVQYDTHHFPELISENKEQILATYRTAIAEYNQAVNSLISEVLIPNIESNPEFKKQKDDVQEYIKSILSGIDFSELKGNDRTYVGINNWVRNNILNPITNNKDNVQESLKELFSLNPDEIQADEYINRVDELINKISSVIGINADVLKDKLGFSNISAIADDTVYSLESVSKQLTNLDVTMDSIEKRIDSMVASISLLDDTLRKLEEGTSLSGKEISKLISEYPELTDKIYQTSEGYTLEIEVLKKLREEKINERRVAIESEMEKTRDVLANISSRIKGYQWEIGAINSVAEARQALSEVTERQKDQSFWDKLWRGITGKPQLDKVGKDLQSYIDLSEKLDKSNRRLNALNAQMLLPTMDNWDSANKKSAKAVKDHTDAINKNKKALEEQKKALENQKKTLEDNQKSINALIDMTVKMLKRQKESEKDALKQSIDGYKTKIDLMKKSLDTQKDEYNYNKKLEEKNRSINKIQNKLSALQFDDSAEAKKKRKELEENLKKEQEDLNNFLHDNAIERQKKALDEEYKSFKRIQDKKIKVIEDYLKHEGNIRQEAMELINSKTKEFYDNLIAWNLAYGDGTTATVVNVWNKAYDALGRFNNGQIDVAKTLGIIADQMGGINNRISGINTSIDNATKAMNNFRNATNESARAGKLAFDEYSKLAGEQKKRAEEKREEDKEEIKNIERKKSLWEDVLDLARSASNWMVNLWDNVSNGLKNTLEGWGSSIWNMLPSQMKDAINNFKIATGTPVKHSKIHEITRKMIKGKYAKGTDSAKKGLANVDEEGAEAILGKSADGRYRFMNEGDVVFSKEATKRLWEYANKRTIAGQFAPKNPLSGVNYTNHQIGSPIVNIEISGNADMETVNALRRESDKIVKKAVEETFKTANKHARL